MWNYPGSYVPLPNIETQALEAVRINLGLQMAAATTYFADPNQANLQSLQWLSTAVGCVNPPNVTYTVDGENQQWTEWYTQITQAIAGLRVQAQRAYGPFSVSS